MKRYFQIYRQLLIVNYHRAQTHKADFISGLFASLMWGIFSVLVVFILTSKSSSVFGWSRAELFVLTGVFNILIGGITRTFFSGNFDRFSHIVQLGELDGLLLKPLSSQFSLSFWYINYANAIRILFAVIYTAIALSFSHIPLTFMSTLLFLVLLLFGAMLMYAFWYIVMTFVIWFPDLYNLTELLYTTDNITRYPPQVLWTMRIAFFFIFFPLTLSVSVPTKVLLHTATVTDVVLLIGVALGLLLFSKFFWNFALRYYTSASA
jgi:ABC-2 type transport system permease protein